MNLGLPMKVLKEWMQYEIKKKRRMRQDINDQMKASGMMDAVLKQLQSMSKPGDEPPQLVPRLADEECFSSGRKIQRKDGWTISLDFQFSDRGQWNIDIFKQEEDFK